MNRLKRRLSILTFLIANFVFGQDCLPADDIPGPYICWPQVSGFQTTNQGFTTDSPPFGFCGTIENNSWFSFSPCASEVEFSLATAGCQKDLGLQAAIYDENLVQVSNCYSSEGTPGTGIITAANLNPDQIYYFMVDGFAGDVCEYYLSAIEGVAPSGDMPPYFSEQPGFIRGASEICPGQIVTYTLNRPVCELNPNEGIDFCPVPDLSNYYDTLFTWTVPAGARVIGNSNEPAITLEWISPMDNTVLSAGMEIVSTQENCGSTVCASGLGIGTCEYFIVDLPIFTKNPVYTELPPREVCQGDCVEYNGQQFCSTGWHEILLQTVDGCDSILLLYVEILPEAEIDLGVIRICENNCYTAGGQSFCQPGYYEVNLQTAKGCDSTLRFDLEIFENNQTDLPPIELCSDTCVEINQQQYCNAGMYQLHLANQQGCDSIVNFKIIKLADKTETLPKQRLCAGDCVEVAGRRICSAGQYQILTSASNGCDSLINVEVEISEIQLSLDRPEILKPGRDSVYIHPNILRNTPHTEISWKGPGLRPADINALQPLVTMPGIFIATLRDTLTGCTASDTIEVFQLNHTCRQNEPIRPGNSCHNAPFICGELMQGYCGTMDTSGLFVPPQLRRLIHRNIENDHWLQWSPCTYRATIRFAALACRYDKGLELSVLTTDDCGYFEPVLNSHVLQSRTVEDIQLDSLVPGNIYYLMLDGMDGDFCDFQIEIVEGISTSPVQWETIKAGYINGGENICLGKVQTFTVIPPDCRLVSNDNCVFPGFTPDYTSGKVHWELPDGAVIVGDSTAQSIGVLFPDSLYIDESQPPHPSGLLARGAIKATFSEGVGLPPDIHCTAAMPSLVINTKSIAIYHEVEILPPVDICEGSSYEFCGKLYTDNSNALCVDDCTTYVQEIRFKSPEYFDYGTVAICNGNCFTMPLSGRKICHPGEYVYPSANKCGGEERVRIVYAEPGELLTGPITEICNPQHNGYYVSFDIIEGVAPYTVNGQLLRNTRFVSPTIPNNQPYDFIIRDSDPCFLETRISGRYDCGPLCVSDAGTMHSEALEVCGEEIAQGLHQNDAELNGGDILSFVLHTGPGEALGTVLAETPTGAFTFESERMTYDKTYYISAVAGSPVQGNIDLNDPCLSVAKGQEVVFYKSPQPLNLSDTIQITCHRDTIILGPGKPVSTTDYQWTLPAGTVVNTPQIRATLPGMYQFLARNDNGCSYSKDILLIENTTPPGIDSGPDGLLQCNTSAISLKGTVAGNDTFYTYEWSTLSGNILSGAMTLTPKVNAAGTYILKATDTRNGCETVDSVEVIQNIDIPRYATFAIEMPSCYGHSDGKIELLEVVGGTPPYEYAFDQAPFSNDMVFTFLKSGTYGITVRDKYHCELTQAIDLPEPPALDVNLGDDVFLMLGQFVTLRSAFSVYPQRILWRSDNGEQMEGRLEWRVQPTESTTYHVLIEDARGCMAQDEVKVTVQESSVYIPNAFSPNSDHRNDVFTVYGGANIAKIHSLKVFDRRGQLLYQRNDFAANDEHDGWNGTFRSKKVLPDVYIYIADIEFINGDRRLFKGDVTLMW